jgi:hypothetical protein
MAAGERPPPGSVVKNVDLTSEKSLARMHPLPSRSWKTV